MTNDEANTKAQLLLRKSIKYDCENIMELWKDFFKRNELKQTYLPLDIIDQHTNESVTDYEYLLYFFG